MDYGGIIFDFNGVLVWDRHLHEQAWREFSGKLRGTPLTREEMAQFMHGRSNHAIVEYLTGRSLSFAEAQNLAREKEAIYRRMCLKMEDEFRLSPGAVPLLNTLVAQEIPHTIATASETENLRFFVEQLQLERWFNLEQIVYDDGSFPMKPAPDIYLRAASRIGVDPARCIVVEDSRSGIAAARTAGIGYVIGLGPERTHAKLQQLPGVDKVVIHLGEIPVARLLGRHN